MDVSTIRRCVRRVKRLVTKHQTKGERRLGTLLMMRGEGYVRGAVIWFVNCRLARRPIQSERARCQGLAGKEGRLKRGNSRPEHRVGKRRQGYNERGTLCWTAKGPRLDLVFNVVVRCKRYEQDMNAIYRPNHVTPVVASLTMTSWNTP